MKTKFRLLGVLVLAGVLIVTYSMAMAGDNSKAANSSNSTTAQQPVKDVEHVPYLGIGVEPVRLSLWSQLRHLFGREQGVLVTAISDGSPAQMAGLEQHDILLTYNDQKLYSPDQLAKLVRADKVGNEVTLGIVRQGKTEQIKVTLGEREDGNQLPMARSTPRYLWSPQWFTYEQAPSDQGSQWKDFDSMTLKNLGKDRFKVEIRYLNKDGKMETHAFEGTLDEIHKAINSEKDLPNVERHQLLRSLDLPGNTSEQFGMQILPDGEVWAPDFSTFQF